MSHGKMHKILIIEDETGLVLSLQDRLESEGYNVKSEEDGLKGEETAESGDFDLIILDVMLPGRDGFKICENLRGKDVHTPILMLTARDTNLDMVMGLRLGADDYLAKPFDMQVLLARVEALLRRSEMNYTDESSVDLNPIREFGRFLLNTDLKELQEHGELVPLSSQEYRLLEYLSSHPCRVISRDEMLNEVWGYETGASTRTVDVHIARIRKKLGEENEPKHIHTARGHGYRFAL